MNFLASASLPTAGVPASAHQCQEPGAVSLFAVNFHMGRASSPPERPEAARDLAVDAHLT